MSHANQAGSNPQKTFDFLKRKRWAELLVTELADAVNFVLSTSGTVLYCGPAFTELTGWRDTDLLDRDILEVVIRAMFQLSRHIHLNLLQLMTMPCFAPVWRNRCIRIPNFWRISASDPTKVRDPKIRITRTSFSRSKGIHATYGIRTWMPKYSLQQQNPIQAGVQNCVSQCCSGALLAHLVSRLDTFLELKIENEQLQRKYFELQNCLPLHPSSSPLVPPPNRVYTTSSIAGIPPQRSTALSNVYGPTCWTVFDNPSNNIDNTLFTDEPIHPSPPSGDDGTEDGSKKKKVRMFYNMLHVYSFDDHQSSRSHTLQSNTFAPNVAEQNLPSGARCAMTTTASNFMYFHIGSAWAQNSLQCLRTPLG